MPMYAHPFSARYWSDAAGELRDLRQLAGAGQIRCRRMFGEYGLWCDGKFFATIEDGMLCLKITQAGRRLLPGAEIVEPHEGARFLYVAELDDRDFLASLVRATCAELPDRKK